MLTKHSISKERLEKLVELYDCNFREGRAQSAPATRTGASEKVTIAEADARAQSECPKGKARRNGTPGRGDAQGLNNVCGGCGSRMPNNELEPSELDRVYPSLEAVDDLRLDDLTRLEDESFYSSGVVVVQAILRDMATTGWTRHAGPASVEVEGGQSTKGTGSRAPWTPSLSRRSDGSRRATPAVGLRPSESVVFS